MLGFFLNFVSWTMKKTFPKNLCLLSKTTADILFVLSRLLNSLNKTRPADVQKCSSKYPEFSFSSTMCLTLLRQNVDGS